MPASRTPPRRAISEPRLILLATGAAGLMLACVVGIILTGDVWLVVVTLLAMGLLAGIVDLDLRRVVERSGDADAEARPAFAIPAGGERVIVVTSEPATAEDVLRAIAPHGAPDAPAVMVVTPDAFGRPARPGDGTLARANAAQGATVARLRAAGVSATGHAGDPDPRRAIDDALRLFPATRVVVLAHGDVLAAYDRTIDAVRLRRRDGVRVEYFDTTPARV